MKKMKKVAYILNVYSVAGEENTKKMAKLGYVLKLNILKKALYSFGLGLNLTTSGKQAYACAIPAIVGSEFCSSETESRRKPAFNQSMAFFVSVAHFTLWWAVRGGASLLGSFGSSLQTSHGLPPVFCSSDGRYIKPLGVLL